MKRVFLHVAPLVEGRWLALSASLRGWWMQLQVYCSSQENGGRIVGARALPSPVWHMILGVGGNLRAIAKLVGAGLATWEGDDLIVWAYDTDSELGYQRKREGGRNGGLASAQRRAARGPEPLETPDELPSNASSNAATNGSSRLAQGSGSEARKGEESGEGVWEARTRVAEVPPATPDEVVNLFASVYWGHFEEAPPRSPSDTLFIRANWKDLDPGELAERISTFVKSHPRGSTLAEFLGWYRGPRSAEARRIGGSQ